jgi:hypothetical protein
MATKTRPDIKWLINETAMLQGELERIDQEMARLVALRAAVERSRAACQRTLEYQAGRKVPGLPTVRAHRQYGRRGDLQQFLAATLRELAPVQLNTAQLAEKAMVRFDLAMSCPAELYDFKMNTVGRALRRLLALGLVERLTTKHRVDRALGTWRWKAKVSTLGALGQLVAGATATEECPGAGTVVGSRPREKQPWP